MTGWEGTTPPLQDEDYLNPPCPSPWINIPDIPHQLLIVVNNHVFNTLVDCGATCSFMDIDLAKTLDIPIVPALGTIQLASASHSLPRFGTTPPLSFTLVLVEDSIRIHSERTHVFELMELSHDQQYQFIVGMDLLREIFPTMN